MMRAMTEGTLSQESVTFRRNRALPGVETMDVERSARDWRCFHTTFGLTLTRSWYGEARYRHKSHAVAPGVAFCTEPGELHTTSRANRAGDFTAFMFVPDVFCEYLEENDDRGGYPSWNKVVHTTSARLATKIAALSGALDPDATAMQAQSCFADVVAAVAAEIMGRVPRAQHASTLRREPRSASASVFMRTAPESI
jgi:hypothetical protein